MPLALKDVFTTADMPTTCGSRILEGWLPPYDATITRRLRDAGVVILGKTNMDEFAMGSSTENSAFGPSHNPWDLEPGPRRLRRGGSAAAVAAFEAPLAIGTDTGGSIRQPAAVCRHRRASSPPTAASPATALVAFSSSLDQAGPLARTVLDAALLHEVIAGHDPLRLDLDRRAGPAGRGRGAAGADVIAGLRVGVVREFSGEGYQPGVLASVRARRSSCWSRSAPRSSRCPARTSTTRCPPTT